MGVNFLIWHLFSLCSLLLWLLLNKNIEENSDTKYFYRTFWNFVIEIWTFLSSRRLRSKDREKKKPLKGTSLQPLQNFLITPHLVWFFPDEKLCLRVISTASTKYITLDCLHNGNGGKESNGFRFHHPAAIDFSAFHEQQNGVSKKHFLHSKEWTAREYQTMLKFNVRFFRQLASHPWLLQQ